MVSLVNGQFDKWSPQSARQNAVINGAQRSGAVQGYMNNNLPPVDPEFDYAQQARDAQIKADTIMQESSANAANNSIIKNINDVIAAQQAQQQAALDAAYAAQGQGSPTLAGSGGTSALPESAYLRALRKVSGMGTREMNADMNMGRYALPTSILQNKQGEDQGGWDRQALGRDISVSDYLNSKKLQNKIAEYKFGKYLNRYGETGAIAKWFQSTGGDASNADALNRYLQRVLSQVKR